MEDNECAERTMGYSYIPNARREIEHRIKSLECQLTGLKYLLSLLPEDIPSDDETGLLMLITTMRWP